MQLGDGRQPLAFEGWARAQFLFFDRHSLPMRSGRVPGMVFDGKSLIERKKSPDKFVGLTLFRIEMWMMNGGNDSKG